MALNLRLSPEEMERLRAACARSRSISSGLSRRFRAINAMIPRVAPRWYQCRPPIGTVYVASQAPGLADGIIVLSVLRRGTPLRAGRHGRIGGRQRLGFERRRG